MLPVDVLQVVLLLLQLEDVPDEELLQVLVGEVDAQLLKAAEWRGEKTKLFRAREVFKSGISEGERKRFDLTFIDMVRGQF